MTPTSTRLARATALALTALSASAWAAHPLTSDDTGTQGAGHWQMELNTDHARTQDAGAVSRQQQVNATLTYGATDDLDLAVNLPWQRLQPAGEATASGAGDVAVQAKWRFFDDQKGWTLALKPVLTLPTGSTSQGLGKGRTGAALALLSSWEVSEPLTLLANAGLAHNANQSGERTGLWNLSAAALYKLNAQWALVADIGTGRSADKARSTESWALAGVLWHLAPNHDLDIGFKRSLGSGPVTQSLGLGWTVRW